MQHNFFASHGLVHERLDNDPLLGDLARRLRRALVRVDHEALSDCMAPHETFGLHHGKTREQYMAYELKEFALKAERFGLLEEGPVAVVRWAHGHTVSVLFSNDAGRLLFENSFTVVPTDDGRVQWGGNGAWLVWQSKLRMTRWMDDQRMIHEHIGRAVNVKTVSDERITHLLMMGKNIINASTIAFDLEKLYGGNFLASQFDVENDPMSTGWGQARVRLDSPEGTSRFGTLHGDLRGADHPFFKPNLYPWVERLDGRPVVRVPPQTYPSVVSAVGHEGSFEMRWKYPNDEVLPLPDWPYEVVVSDHLGHDWASRWDTYPL